VLAAFRRARDGGEGATHDSEVLRPHASTSSYSQASQVTEACRLLQHETQLALQRPARFGQ